MPATNWEDQNDYDAEFTSWPRLNSLGARLLECGQFLYGRWLFRKQSQEYASLMLEARVTIRALRLQLDAARNQ